MAHEKSRKKQNKRGITSREHSCSKPLHSETIRFRVSSMRMLGYETKSGQKIGSLKDMKNTINHLRNRYVDHARNPSKDNTIIIE